MLALLPVLSTIVSAAPVAQEIWGIVRPILEAQRDPTPEEWATLNAMADRAHAEMQRTPDA